MSQQHRPPLLLPKITEGIDPSSAAAFLGLLTIALFASSVMYDWGYLSALGLTFADIPLTLADITQSALHWLPGIFLVTFATIAMEMITRRVEDGRTEDELAPQDTAPRIRAFRHWTRLLTPLPLPIAGIIAFAYIGELAVALFAGVCAFLWLVIAGWVVRHPVIGGGMDLTRRRAFYFGPAVAIVLFGMGWHFGLQALIHPRHTATIQVSDDGALVVPLIRSYENGVLFRLRDRIEFMRWERVTSISMPSRGHYWSGVLRRGDSEPTAN